MRSFAAAFAALLVLAPSAPAAGAIDPSARQVYKLEQKVQAFCKAHNAKGKCRPRLSKAGNAPATKLTFGLYQPERGHGPPWARRWIVNWHYTFTDANTALPRVRYDETIARPDYKGPKKLNRKERRAIAILDEARRYAVRHPGGLLRFQQYQYGNECYPENSPACDARDKRPWVSALSTAGALTAYARAGQLQLRRGFRAHARRQFAMVHEQLKLFQTERGDDGGLESEGIVGPHYPLYSFNPKNLVFNSFAQSVAAFSEVSQLNPVGAEDFDMDPMTASDLGQLGIEELQAEYKHVAYCRSGAVGPAYNLLARDGVFERGLIENKDHVNSSLNALGRIDEGLASLAEDKPIATMIAELEAWRPSAPPKHTRPACR